MQAIKIKTPIGELSLVFDDELNLVEIKRDCLTEYLKDYPGQLKFLIKLFDAYFSGEISEIEYPVRLRVSEFDSRVLQFIRKIPFGKTVSYKFIAERLETSPRAIGQALKRNPLPIIIPCHRIIKSDGSLGGYSLSVEAKKWLIEHEKATLYKLLSHKTLSSYEY